MVVGRLAPSPTGSLHLGNVRTFLWAWLSARSQGGRVILRIEDLETNRVKPGACERLVEELAWLGFDWDEGPVRQTERRDRYRALFPKLDAYPCACSRADLEQAAPHEGDAEPRYPGTCREHPPPVARSWRFRVEPGVLAFDDLLSGRHEIDVAGTVGDFVVAKSPDDPAYQFAVVADDIAMGVTEVVRGDDLIPSTARQILLYRKLGAPVPAYGHVPLVVGPDGKRLAKRHGDGRISTYRARGVAPERVIGAVARWSGFDVTAARPADLVGRWSWDRPRERVVLTPDRFRL
ncbi:MAG: tRNA glutamyl-Q(34) synthetase GluQRS [Planctomycetes bacterium]|nr:tRNA glutamyl-Q(34) synthetase GluQRS [Planctomycetota bacterium]